MVPHHESIILVDASGTLINQLGTPTDRCLRRGVGSEKLAIICSNQPTQPSKSRDLRQEVALRMIWWRGPVVEVSEYSIIFRLTGESFECLKYTLVFSTSTQWKFVHKVEQDVKTCLQV